MIRGRWAAGGTSPTSSCASSRLLRREAASSAVLPSTRVPTSSRAVRIRRHPGSVRDHSGALLAAWMARVITSLWWPSGAMAGMVSAIAASPGTSGSTHLAQCARTPARGSISRHTPQRPGLWLGKNPSHHPNKRRRSGTSKRRRRRGDRISLPGGRSSASTPHPCAR